MAGARQTTGLYSARAVRTEGPDATGKGRRLLPIPEIEFRRTLGAYNTGCSGSRGRRLDAPPSVFGHGRGGLQPVRRQTCAAS